MIQDCPLWLQFLLCVLATWRLTHFLVAEDGPFQCVVRLRAKLGDSEIGRAMDCFYCSSIWVSLPFSCIFAVSPLAWIITWFALSGAACLLWQTSNKLKGNV